MELILVMQGIYVPLHIFHVLDTTIIAASVSMRPKRLFNSMWDYSGRVSSFLWPIGCPFSYSCFITGRLGRGKGKIISVDIWSVGTYWEKRMIGIRRADTLFAIKLASTTIFVSHFSL